MSDKVLPDWPSSLRHIITGYSKAQRDDYDEDRCGPVLMIDGEWTWCNEGDGLLGHINGLLAIATDWICCPYCGMRW